MICKVWCLQWISVVIKKKKQTLSYQYVITFLLTFLHFLYDEVHCEAEHGHDDSKKSQKDPVFPDKL